MKPTYTATTQLFVAIQNSGTVSELQQGNSFTQARIQSYVTTVETPVVLQPAIDALGLQLTPQQLASKVEATADLNTVIVTVSVEDESPTQAAAMAQAVSDSLVDAVESLEGSSSANISPVKLSVITPATAPLEPSSPNVPLNVSVGFLLGLVGGMCAAALRTMMDNRIRDEADLRAATPAPLLGGILYDQDAGKKPLLTQVTGHSPRAESFRQIRTNIQFAHVSRKSKSFLVTSSIPNEGKSTTAVNMAIAMAQAGQRVVLVDGDLRRPMVAEYLGLERNVGVTTALVGGGNVLDLLQPWGENDLFVLASGVIPPNPSELLGSDSMGELVAQLEENFDAVIIDAPPLLPVTDAAVLSQKVGGAVLVVGSAKVRKYELERALSSLNLVNSDLLGVVMNLLPAKGPSAYSYAYYSYAPDSPRRESKKASRPAPIQRNGRLRGRNARIGVSGNHWS